MAIELDEYYVSVIPEAKGISSSLARQFRPAQSIAATAGRNSGRRFSGAFSSATSSIGRGLATALKYGVGAAALGIGAAGAVGLKTAAQLETAKIGFTTMLGSGKKAESFLGRLSKFAAKTPFDLPGLQENASQLVAIGIKSKDVIPIMTSLGNITSGMGTGAEGIARATRAIQQMNAAGKITAEDLNQLRDAGVPVYDLLTKATGKSTKQISEMRDAGELGRKELDALMELLKSGKGLERFNGLMQKQSQSLTGLASTFKDTFSVGLAKALEPIIPLIKDGLAGATKLLADVILPKVQSGLRAVVKWGKQLDFSSFSAFMDSLAGSGSGKAVASISKSFRKMWPAVQKLVMSMPSFADVLTVTSGIMGFVADHMGTIIKFLPLIIGGFIAYKVAAMGLNALEQLRLPVTIAQTVANIKLAASQRALMQSQAGMTTATRANTVATATNTGTQRKGLLVRLRSAAATVGHKVAMVASTVATKTATIAQRALNLAMRMNPIGIIITAITALVAGLVWFFTQTKLGKKIWDKVWTGIKVVTKVVWAFIKNKVLDPAVKFFTVLLPAALKIVGKWFSDTWNGIEKAVRIVWNWVENNVLQPIKKYFTVIVPKALELLGKWFRDVWNKIEKVARTVWNWVEKHVLKPIKTYFTVIVPKALGKLRRFFQDTWNKIERVVRAVWNWIEKHVLKPIKRYFTVIVPRALDKLRQFFKDTWEKIKDAVRKPYNWVKRNVFDPLKKFVTKTIPDAFKRGVKGIKSFWNDLKRIAKIPVKFVVNTVLNKGLFAAFNNVMKFLKLPARIDPIQLPPGFEKGGKAPKGMAIVGEAGPELVDFARPARVYTADKLRQAMGTDNGVGVGAVANRISGGGGGGGGRGGSSGGFMWPVSRQYPITQFPSGVHPAYDIGTPIGTAVRAAASGRVTKAGPGYRAPGVWGGTEAWIGHGGVASLYAHLSRLLVGVGERVQQGEIIARSGNTGISSGPHLHFGAFRNGKMVSPGPWLNGKGVGGVGGGGGFNPLAWVAEKVTGAVSGLIEKIPGEGAFFDIALGIGKYLFDKAKDWAVNMVTPGDQQPGLGAMSTLYDRGGKVMPGRTDVLNLHNKPEALLSPWQWSTSHRAIQVAEQLAEAGPQAPALPRKVVLRIGDREFTAYVDELTDARLGNVSTMVKGRRR